jgi:cation diffusion facilitator family transporter
MEHGDPTKADAIAYEGKRLAFLSAGLNVFFIASKFSLYLFSGSSAILAETAHSLTDLIGSLMVIGGMYLSEKKLEKFPWGLYKVENIVALFSTAMIFLSAYEIASMTFHPAAGGIKNFDMTLTALFLMTFPVILFSRYEAKMAKAINFPSLMADAKHWRTDIAPLIIVVAGIVGARFSHPIMDRVSAFVILILVVKAGFGILRDSIKSLLDASIDKTTLDKITSLLRGGFPQVKQVISLHARNSGRFIFVNMVLAMSSKKLKDAHEIADNIEDEIKRQIPFVGRVIIHYEPEKKDHQRFAVPLVDKEGVISEHFSKAPFIALWNNGSLNSEARNPQILENPFIGQEKGRGLRLAEFLVGKEVDIVYTKEDFKGKAPDHVFSSGEVQVKKTDIKTLKELMNQKAMRAR